jgi:hemoglobin
MKLRSALAWTLCGLAWMAGPGCMGRGESHMPDSGDPEADRRADLRVGSDDGKGGAKQASTLYQRLGGAPTINAIVDDMTTRTMADPRVNFERKNVRTDWIGSKYKAWDPTSENVERFKKRMVEFLTLASGGPAEYSGRDMRTAHKGMRISNSEFDAMVGDFKVSMDKLGIAAREKRDLLSIIETTRKEVVEK